MQATIISIGNELLNGKTVNSNATFISGRLHDIGISTQQILTIRDEADSITAALKKALSETEVVLLTGGLGPTHDDITKKVIADYFDSELVFHESIVQKIEKRFRKRGLEMPEVNRNQAYLPEKAEMIPNPVGTAPGMYFQESDQHVFVLPGVPDEMKGMIDKTILSKLQETRDLSPLDIHYYRTTRIPESRMYELCEDFFAEFPDFEIAFLPKFTGVDIRVAVPVEKTENGGAFERFEEGVYERLGNYIYTKGKKELEEVVGNLLREKELQLAVAESFTGGLIQDRLTDIPGSSDYFLGGLVTYSNESKIRFLDVKEATLQQHGAVSEAIAKEMAQGVRRRMGADLGLSTTGIAGPGGATAEKPVGLVYLGLASGDEVVAKKFQLGNDRQINKAQGAQFALEMLRRKLQGMAL